MNTTTHPESVALAASSQSPHPLAPGMTSAAALMLDERSMDRLIRVAEMMASGKSTIPVHLRNSPGDCLAVVMQATQWGMNPFAVAQKTHLVNGTLGYEAQLVAAVINNSPLIKDRFNFEWFGEWTNVIGKYVEKDSKRNPGEVYRAPGWNLNDEKGLGVRVWATIKGESVARVLELLLSQAGVRNSSLWADDPKQQLAYLAEKRWARLHAPDVILGVYTPDELEAAPAIVHMGDADVVGKQTPVDERAEANKKLIADAKDAARKGKAAFQAFIKPLPEEVRRVLTAERPELERLWTEADAKRTVNNDADPSQFPPSDDKATTTASTGGKTFDQVMTMLCEARSEDALTVAADWIETITDPVSVDMLNAKHAELLEKIRGGA